MKSLKSIMEDLGFNKEASPDVQRAFIRHLVQAAHQTPNQSLENKTKVQEKRCDKTSVVPTQEQLEFDFSNDTTKKQVS